MRLRRWLEHAVFGVLGMTALVFCALVVLGSVRMVNQPFLGFGLDNQNYVLPLGAESWGARAAGLQLWDRVVAVDGTPTPTQAAVRAAALPAAQDAASMRAHAFTLEVERPDGERAFVRLHARVFETRDLVRSYAAQGILGFVFVLLAVVLYFMRPGTAEAWSFFGFFAGLGMALAAVVETTLLSQRLLHTSLYMWIAPYLATLGMVLVAVITRLFEVPAKPPDLDSETGRHYRVAVQARRWVLGGLVVSVAISSIIATGLVLTSGQGPAYLAWDTALYAWIGIHTTAVVGILIAVYRFGRSTRIRARLRLILWAWPVGAGIPILQLFVGHIMGWAPLSPIWNAFLLFVPISTADAMVRHDLLNLGRRARRFVGSVTVSTLVGIALGGFLWSTAASLNVSDAPAMVALAAVMFAVAAPVTHRIQRAVDKLLRPTRYDAGTLLAAFSEKVSTATHLDAVGGVLKTTLTRSVQPAWFELWRVSAEGQSMQPMLDVRPEMAMTDAVQRLLVAPGVVAFDLDMPAPSALGHDGSAAVFALRLAVANEPVGLIVLGPRTDARAYEPDDMAFVASLAGPLAAAMVNTVAYAAIEAMNHELEGRVQARTKELETKNTELALLNQRKDELVATVSHDFRSPLAIIRQNVQTILRDVRDMDEEDLQDFLGAIARQEERLTLMSNNLLDLAKLKHTAPPTDLVDLVKLSTSLLDGFQPKARAQDVALTFEARHDVPAVRGDEGRLSQVLQNLVDNALRFSEPGGRVTVELAPRAGQVVWTVSDTGCGIPKAAIERLFEPFYQVPRTTHVGQGSGLGLAIVHEIVTSHGGGITVESQERAGTVFTVRLPAAETER